MYNIYLKYSYRLQLLSVLLFSIQRQCFGVLVVGALFEAHGDIPVITKMGNVM